MEEKISRLLIFVKINFFEKLYFDKIIILCFLFQKAKITFREVFEMLLFFEPKFKSSKVSLCARKFLIVSSPKMKMR